VGHGNRFVGASDEFRQLRPQLGPFCGFRYRAVRFRVLPGVSDGLPSTREYGRTVPSENCNSTAPRLVRRSAGRAGCRSATDKRRLDWKRPRKSSRMKAFRFARASCETASQLKGNATGSLEGPCWGIRNSHARTGKPSFCCFYVGVSNPAAVCLLLNGIQLDRRFAGTNLAPSNYNSRTGPSSRTPGGMGDHPRRLAIRENRTARYRNPQRGPC